MALRFNGSIFQSGYDTESTLALLLLVLELSFAIGRLLVVLLPRVLRSLIQVYFCSDYLTLSAPNFEVVPAGISPPLPLRI